MSRLGVCPGCCFYFASFLKPTANSQSSQLCHSMAAACWRSGRCMSSCWLVLVQSINRQARAGRRASHLTCALVVRVGAKDGLTLLARPRQPKLEFRILRSVLVLAITGQLWLRNVTKNASKAITPIPGLD